MYVPKYSSLTYIYIYIEREICIHIFSRHNGCSTRVCVAIISSVKGMGLAEDSGPDLRLQRSGWSGLGFGFDGQVWAYRAAASNALRLADRRVQRLRVTWFLFVGKKVLELKGRVEA